MKKFDDFEKDILVAFEKGELVSTKSTRQEKEKYKAAAIPVKRSASFYTLD